MPNTLSMIGAALFRHVGSVDEFPHACRTEIVHVAEFLRNVEVSLSRRLNLEKWFGCCDKLLHTPWKVTDAEVDVVGVLQFEAVRDGIALHGQQRRNGCNGNLNAVSSTVGHVTFHGDELG